MAGSELVAPVLLLAMPQIVDPFFRKSVVLLLAHEEEGSFGFIVNRRTELRIRDVLHDLGLDWGGDPEVPARFGGPVQPHVGSVLFSRGATEPELPDLPEASEVCPGIRVTQNLSELARLAGHPPSRLHLLLGYAGWGPGQLVGEILRNDWLTAPVDAGLVFAEGTEHTWERALRGVGVDPAALPAWTGSEDEGAAN
jgi:putative transcriptional regulator